jgi:hypothetical protein
VTDNQPARSLRAPTASRRLNDRHRDTFAAHAHPTAIELALRAEKAERRRVDSRIAWLEDLLARRNREIAEGTWPTATP